jgi:hypothetical protein
MADDGVLLYAPRRAILEFPLPGLELQVEDNCSASCDMHRQRLKHRHREVNTKTSSQDTIMVCLTYSHSQFLHVPLEFISPGNGAALQEINPGPQLIMHLHKAGPLIEELSPQLKETTKVRQVGHSDKGLVTKKPSQNRIRDTERVKNSSAHLGQLNNTALGRSLDDRQSGSAKVDRHPRHCHRDSAGGISRTSSTLMGATTKRTPTRNVSRRQGGRQRRSPITTLTSSRRQGGVKQIPRRHRVKPRIPL